jgi:Tfp pilus assembly protein PilX
MRQLRDEGGRFRAFQESGVALVLVLLVMLVLTLLSAALVFTARS